MKILRNSRREAKPLLISYDIDVLRRQYRQESMIRVHVENVAIGLDATLSEDLLGVFVEVSFPGFADELESWCRVDEWEVGCFGACEEADEEDAADRESEDEANCVLCVPGFGEGCP